MIRRLKKEVMSQLPPKKRQKVEIQTDPKVIKQIMAINLSSEKIIEKFSQINNSSLNPNLVTFINEGKDEGEEGDSL